MRATRTPNCHRVASTATTTTTTTGATTSHSSSKKVKMRRQLPVAPTPASGLPVGRKWQFRVGGARIPLALCVIVAGVLLAAAQEERVQKWPVEEAARSRRAAPTSVSGGRFASSIFSPKLQQSQAHQVGPNSQQQSGEFCSLFEL